MENLFTDLVFILLLLLTAVNLFRLWTERDLSKISQLILWLTLAAIVAVIVVRTAAAGRVPFANLYEFALLFSCGILVFALWVRQGLDSSRLDLSVAVLLLIIIAISTTLPSELGPLMPALQSTWLHAHVATAVIAYGCFALAACLGVVALSRSQQTAPGLDEIENRIYRMVVLGFIFLTIVIITGAVWAEEVWGNWWSWDPKETWSLVTWLIYAAYLHARRSYGWKGRKSAWMVIIGFVIVMFTLFGVSILLPGLHSYL